jgi:hypothetical protein
VDIRVRPSLSSASKSSLEGRSGLVMPRKEGSRGGGGFLEILRVAAKVGDGMDTLLGPRNVSRPRYESLDFMREIGGDILGRLLDDRRDLLQKTAIRPVVKTKNTPPRMLKMMMACFLKDDPRVDIVVGSGALFGLSAKTTSRRSNSRFFGTSTACYGA